MTAVQQNVMNTELWQSIGAIADNETLMQRLTRYAKKLAKEKLDNALLSEEDFFARVEEARKEYDEGKYHTFYCVEELDKHIRSLWITKYAMLIKPNKIWYVFAEMSQVPTKRL